MSDPLACSVTEASTSVLRSGMAGGRRPPCSEHRLASCRWPCTGCAQLLIARDLLRSLLSSSRSHTLSAALPNVFALVIVLAISGLVNVLQTEMQRLLAELVAWRSMQRVISAATAADLANFEDPSFHDRLQRAIVNATIRPLAMTTGLLTVGSSVLGTAAVSVTLGSGTSLTSLPRI